MPTHTHTAFTPDKLSIRDYMFSKWHRLLKTWFCMQDVDHTTNTSPDYNADFNTTWLPYGNQGPIAVWEEKHHSTYKVDLTSSQFKNIRWMSRDGLESAIPAFALLVNCEEDDPADKLIPTPLPFKTFYIIAANNKAREFMKSHKMLDRMYLSEQNFFHFECLLRGLDPRVCKADIPLSREKNEFPLPIIVNF